MLINGCVLTVLSKIVVLLMKVSCVMPEPYLHQTQSILAFLCMLVVLSFDTSSDSSFLLGKQLNVVPENNEVLAAKPCFISN